MGLITSPESAILGAAAGAHGFDDVGFSQPSGSISAAADASGYAGGRFTSKTKLTLSTTGSAGPEKGQPINIVGTGPYAGVTRVLHKINATNVIVDKTFGATGVTAPWNMNGGQSAWTGMMPIGADLPAASIEILTFWDEKAQTGNEKAVPYTKDQIYMFPGVIKTIRLTSSGDVRLFRHSTLNPGALATGATFPATS